MNTAEYVDELIKKLKEEQIPISDAAWEVALSCEGWPYVFGAWGEFCTPANRKRRAREDHPTIVSKCQVLNGKKANCNGCQWLPEGKNVRCYDCRGFTDWVLKQFGIDLTGEGATSQWNSDNWEKKGPISEVPDDVLVCLFVQSKDNPKKMSHTGLGYHGETCECSSGVQHFTKRNKKWTHYAIPKNIGCGDPDYKPTLRRGSKGEYVTLLQTELLRRGYDLGKCGVDGDFGKATLAAVKAFQQEAGLNPDGIVGSDTWKALELPTVKYTVTIPNLYKAKAEELVSQFAGAVMKEQG